MATKPNVTDIKDATYVNRLVLEITELNAIGEQEGGQTTDLLVVEALNGTPEGRSLGSPGDLRVRQDVPELYQKITGERTLSGWAQIGSGGGGGTRLGRVCYVDGTQSPAAPDGAISNPFPTITEGLAAVAALVPPPSAADPATIIVADTTYDETITIPTGVSLTATNSAGAICRIRPAASGDTVVTLLTGSEISGFRIEGANTGAGKGIASASSFTRVNNCLVTDCVTAYFADGGASTLLICNNCIALRTVGTVMTTGYRAEGGAQVHAFVSRAQGFPGAFISGAGFSASGASSEVHMHAGSAIRCENGLQAELSGLIEGHAPRVVGCTTGQRLGPGASGTMRTAGLLGFNVTNDILVDGATSILEQLSGEADLDLVTLLPDTTLAGDMSARQTVNLDPVRQFISNTSIGLPLFPRILGAGQGLSQNVGMLAFTYDDTAPSGSRFTDVTVAARSRVASTVGFPAGTTTGDAILIGVPLQFGGIVTDVATAMDPTGVLTWEYFTGAGWTEMPPGGARGSGISVHTSLLTGTEYRANVAWEVAELQEISINDEIRPTWVSSSGLLDETPVTAVPIFWIRTRPSSLPAVTFPLIQQFQVVYGTTVVSPSGVILDGTSRVRQATLINSNLFEKGTVDPGNQDIAYSTTILVGNKSNAFEGPADKDPIGEAGIAIPIPFEWDLSTPIEMEIEWMPDDGTAGDVEWQLYYAVHTPTDTLATALPGPLTEITDFNIEAAGGVALVGQVSTHELRIPNANPDDGDTLVLMVRRDSTAGNPNDTYAGIAIVRSYKLNALIWRDGKTIL